LTSPHGFFERQEQILFEESDGAALLAAWFDAAVLDTEEIPALFPEGLKARLLEG
jgi:hypothetical protein